MASKRTRTAAKSAAQKARTIANIRNRRRKHLTLHPKDAEAHTKTQFKIGPDGFVVRDRDGQMITRKIEVSSSMDRIQRWREAV